MPDDGPDEEPVVADLPAARDLGPAQVEVHLVVGRGDGVQVIVLQAVQLQLECQRRLQMSVDEILGEVVARAVGEVLGELLGPGKKESR